MGTAAGFLGAFVVALTAVMIMPFCLVDTGNLQDGILGSVRPGMLGGIGWGLQEQTGFLLCVTIWGGFGSLLDSILGGWFQASVVDTRTGKVVEGSGGKKVILSLRSRR